MDELIRKQDALDAFNGNITISAARNAGRVYTYLKMVTDRIKALPPVQQNRKTSEWIYGEDDCGQDGWFCSKCRFFVPWYYKYYDDSDFISEYKTCPCCDAKMISYTGKRGEADGQN